MIKTEYITQKVPVGMLELHPLPSLQPIDGKYTSESLIKAYKDSIHEIKLCNVTLTNIKEWGAE